MEDEILDEEFSIMFQESQRVKVLDSTTFMQPIKHLKLRKPITLSLGKTVDDAVNLMTQMGVGCILITKEDKLSGILTERDIITKALSKKKDLSTMKLEDIMTTNPESFQPDDPVAFAINAMDVGGYRHVPVVNEKNQPLAIISVKDIIGFLAEHFSEEVLNLPPKPVRRVDQQDGG